MTSKPKGQTAVPVWSDDDVVKALVNDDGEIPVNVENLPTTIEARGYGWDGTLWRKLPMIWGFSDNYGEAEQGTASQPGTITLTFSTVPDGEVWYISGITGRSYTVSPTSYDCAAIINDVSILMANGPNPGNYVTTPQVSGIYLAKDDYMQFHWNGCLTNNIVEAFAWGYKMKVAE